jgi:adenylyltransferase/sulfurtransferase
LLATNDVACLTLVDPDTVELSNLHRQPLYRDDDIGRAKAEVAAERLSPRFAGAVRPMIAALDASNAEALIDAHDFVIDATDSPRTKFLINDTAATLRVAWSYGGAARTGGQALAIVPQRSACLRCVFPDPISDDAPGACTDLGILGPAAAVIGSLQALHALAWIAGRPLSAGVMYVYDIRGGRWQTVPFTRRAQCSACGESASTETTRRPLPCHS